MKQGKEKAEFISFLLHERSKTKIRTQEMTNKHDKLLKQNDAISLLAIKN